MKTKMQQLWTRIGVALGLVWLAMTANAQTVTTIGGGYVTPPYSGYNNIDITTINARFNQPSGLAMDPAGNYLFVADYSNNVVRVVTSPGKNGSLTKTFFNPSPAYSNVTAGISRPISVWVDAATNVYVLNQGTGTDGSLLKFTFTPSDCLPISVITNALHLTNATALAMLGSTNAFVTVQNNTVLRITPPNIITVVGVITNPGVSLDGIAVLDNGKLALSDGGTNSGIWLMNPSVANPSNNVTVLAGFNGVGDDYYPSPDNWPKSAQFAHFNHPTTLAKAANGILVVADSGNNRVKLVDTVAGTVNLLYGVNSNYWGDPNTSSDHWPGWIDGASGTLAGYAESRLPNGVVVAPDGSVFASEDYYHILRHVTATGLSAPTGSSGSTNGVTATNYPPAFNYPQGISLDPGANNLYIADPTNNTVWRLTFPNTTVTFLSMNDGLTNPVSVLVDPAKIDPAIPDYYYVYVLNQNAGTNGSILQFDTDGNGYGPLTTGLNQPTAFTRDGNGNLFVAEQSGAIKVIFPATGIANTIVNIATNANVQLQGIAILDNGNIAVSDAGNHVIWTVNPLTKVYSRLTGQIGISGTNVGTTNFAKLNQPHQLARSGTQLLIADSGNNRLVLVTPSGTTLTNGLNSSAASLWFGNPNDPVTGTNATPYPMAYPSGLTVSTAGAIYVSEPTNQAIRSLTTAITGPPTVPIVDLPYSISPTGIAYDSYGQIYGPYGTKNLFIADSVNNAVQVLNLDNNVTATFLSSLNGITNPVAVVVNTNEYIYVLNQNTGTNGYISAYDIYGNPLGTNFTGLNHPTDFTLDGYGNFYVVEQSGNIRYFGVGVSNTLVTITNANVSLQGIALFDDGSLAVSDAANHVIWSINAITKTVSRLTGQLGLSGTNFGSAAFAKLNQPRHLARAGNNQLIIADYGNNRLLTLARDGSITHALNSTNASVWFGQSGDPVANTSPQFIPMIKPSGVAVGNGLVFASETYYADIRGLNNSGVISPVSNPGVPLPVFAGQGGIVLNMLGTTLFISDSTNNTIWSLNLNNNLTTAFLSPTNGLDSPVDVAVDSSDNLYVLNRGNGINGFILEFNKYGNLLTTNATGITQATAMKYNYSGGIFVTESGGRIIRFNGTNSNVVAAISTNNVELQGITFLDNGSLVVSDAGNHVLWKINSDTANATIFTGLFGNHGATLGSTQYAKLNKPQRISGAYGGLIAIVDSGNNRIVLADDLGNLTTVLNSTNATLWFGQPIDPVFPSSPYFVPMNSPVGVTIGNGGTVFASENMFKDIRGISATGLLPLPLPPPAPLNPSANSPNPGMITLSWQPSLGATNYIIERSTDSGGPYDVVGNTTSTTFSDTINNNLHAFVNGIPYFYVIVAVGSGGSANNSAEVTAMAKIPQVTAPQIGIVDFPADYAPNSFRSVFHDKSGSVYNFYNDAPPYIVIKTTDDNGSCQTHYTWESTTLSTNSPYTNNVPDPSIYQYFAPLNYEDGLDPNAVGKLAIYITQPDFTLQAYTSRDGYPTSSIVLAHFKFITSDPQINGMNAAQFTISDGTDNARLIYTVDGTDPSTNNPNGISLSSLGDRTNLWQIKLTISTNTTFKVRAYRDNYEPSQIITQVLSTDNYKPTTISFGAPAGESHSSFIARPGQLFFAPVTLKLANGFGNMYSLQFNIVVTNGIAYAAATNLQAYTNITYSYNHDANGTPLSTNISTETPIQTNIFYYTDSLPQTTTNCFPWANTTTFITNGVTNSIVVNYFTNLIIFTNTRTQPPQIQNSSGIGFFSMLMSTMPDLASATYFPASDSGSYLPIPTIIFSPNTIIPGTNGLPGSTNLNITSPLYPSQFTNNNLLGVGWFYRPGIIYNYLSDPSGMENVWFAPDSSKDLIAFSIVHDILFKKSGGLVLCGAYSFRVPTNANLGDKYFIQIGSPSATSDGVGAPGSSIYIAPPDHSQAVTVSTPTYLVGDVAPFHWLNAGDFGDTNLDNADVMQIYESAIAQLNMPPPSSDLFNVMDSSGVNGIWDGLNNYYTNSMTPNTPTQQQALWDGNDTTINSVAFGDGILDITDLFVTFRRSLDPSLIWFQRFWTNNQFVATTIPNLAYNTNLANVPHVVPKSAAKRATNAKVTSNSDYRNASICFTAVDAMVTTNQMIQIPINAQIFGDYPLRILGLNLSIVPLDGSPPIAQPITFTPVAGLGTPTISSSKGPANYCGAWLNTSINGLSGNTQIGTLTLSLPTSCTSLSAYAIHFDHASASPNGLASFPKQTITGLITLSSRTNSSYNDGIPDSWRLRWFGTANNLLSVSNACPSGDGINNWMKFVAGVDPNVAGNFPSLNPKTPVPSGYVNAIHWPTVIGKNYIIERSSSLFPGTWSTINTNTGTGTDMEFDDNTGGTQQFYRVRIFP